MMIVLRVAYMNTYHNDAQIGLNDEFDFIKIKTVYFTVKLSYKYILIVFILVYFIRCDLR